MKTKKVMFENYGTSRVYEILLWSIFEDTMQYNKIKMHELLEIENIKKIAQLLLAPSQLHFVLAPA